MLSPSGHVILADHGTAYAVGSSSGDVAGHGGLTETGVPRLGSVAAPAATSRLAADG
jgi:hypothetical protein